MCNFSCYPHFCLHYIYLHLVDMYQFFSSATHSHLLLLCQVLSLLWTHLVVYHMSLAVDTAHMPIKRSPLALNLPALLPRALETERGRAGVTLLHVLIHTNPTALLFSLPTSPRSERTPNNSSPQPQVKGQVLLKVFVFIP